MKRNTKRRRSPAGYTIVELLSVMAILAFLLALLCEITGDTNLHLQLSQAEVDIRDAQEAALLYYMHYEQVPTKHQLYLTFLKNRREMDFVLLPLNEKTARLFCLQSPQATGGEVKPCRTDGRWVIFTKRDFRPRAEFIYVVDDNRPVTVESETAAPAHGELVALARLNGAI